MIPAKGATSMTKVLQDRVSAMEIQQAYEVLKDVVIKTPLQLDPILSERYNCKVYLKRE